MLQTWCTSCVWGCLTTHWLMRGLIIRTRTLILCDVQNAHFLIFQCKLLLLGQFTYWGCQCEALLLFLWFSSFCSPPGPTNSNATWHLDANFLLCQYRARKERKLTTKSRLQSLQSILVFLEVWRTKIVCFLTEYRTMKSDTQRCRRLELLVNLNSGCPVVGPRCHFQANLFSSWFWWPMHHDWCLQENVSQKLFCTRS